MKHLHRREEWGEREREGEREGESIGGQLAGSVLGITCPTIIRGQDWEGRGADRGNPGNDDVFRTCSSLR